MGNDSIKTKYKINKNPFFGYRYLDPLPSESEIRHFYKKKYYKKMRDKEETRESKLLSDERATRKKELNWLENTYFIDRLDIFTEYLFSSNQRKILDIGCGSGDFLKFMNKFEWEELGIEPSKEVFKQAKEKGIRVYNLSLEKFIERKKENDKFDAIVLSNVLEHVLKPKETLVILKRLLSPGGIVCVQVPNDFNQLQILASEKKVAKKEWWITIPDHINYFNFQSLEKLLKFYGLEILLKTTDFPMELFLLMGDDYVGNPKIGKACHQKRVDFELSIPAEIRRNFYNKLAELGLGRQCIIYARNKI